MSPARGPPTDWGELVQSHDDRDVFQASPDELPAIDIHSARWVVVPDRVYIVFPCFRQPGCEANGVGAFALPVVMEGTACVRAGIAGAGQLLTGAFRILVIDDHAGDLRGFERDKFLAAGG